MNKIGIGERAPWGAFPKVVRNGDLGALQDEPEYLAAKGGDREAALNLVDRLVTDDTVSQIKAVIGNDRPLLVPVLAVEDAGTNKIPLAMAEVLADRTGLDVELGIVQREKVSRTGTGSDHRLAFNPTFEGSVQPGQKYLILDDTLTMGGTLASLRGYIENRGGKVVAASVMTAHPGAVDLAAKPAMLAAIAQKHGPAMDTFWKETFGYGIDHLTQGEAGHLKAAPSVDAIRTRIVEARNAGFERLDAGRTQAAAGASQQTTLTDPGAGEGVLEAAQAAQAEQQAMLGAAPVEQTYQAALASYVAGKHDQVERLEDRLETMIEQQEARLQRTQANTPGLLSRPGTRRAWQAQQTQQQARLQTLHNRLDAVREIKEGMGVHAPRVEELATRKMRAENPELASDWDAMREAARKHEILMRQKDKEKERTQTQERGRSQSLSLSRPTS